MPGVPKVLKVPSKYVIPAKAGIFKVAQSNYIQFTFLLLFLSGSFWETLRSLRLNIFTAKFRRASIYYLLITFSFNFQLSTLNFFYGLWSMDYGLLIVLPVYSASIPDGLLYRYKLKPNCFLYFFIGVKCGVPA